MVGAAPSVSIGMPVFNGEQWLRVAVEAVLAQTYRDFEFVIADNCSTDTTWSICKEYADRDPRIRLIRNSRNIGAPENFNRVFRESCAPYFQWVSCNDLIASTCLERCVAVLDQHPEVVLSYAKSNLIDADGKLIQAYNDNVHLDQTDPIARVRHFLQHARMNNAEHGLFRRDVLERSMLLRKFRSADILLLAEVSLHGQVFEVPEYLFARRVAMNASSNLLSDKARADFLKQSVCSRKLELLAMLLASIGMIARAPLTSRQRIEAARLTLNWLRWSAR